MLEGFLLASLHPNAQNLERAVHWGEESRLRRQQLKRLERRGLIESGGGAADGSWTARVTELGRAAFAGGRDPEAAWSRPWDGRWRLLTFDLPRGQNEVRMKMRRWMLANWFGRLQGSVWISPDPVPELGALLSADQIAATDFIVFEGGVAGGLEPAEVAAASWDFAAIDKAYRAYEEFAAGCLDTLPAKALPAAQLRKILREDREKWWAAVRSDPLLPEALHPKGYRGSKAWRTRGRLLKRLRKALGDS